MDMTRREFGFHSVVATVTAPSILVPLGVTGLTCSAIVIPRQAHAFLPLAVGAFFAKALYEIFGGYGLSKQHLQVLHDAEPMPAKAPSGFHDYFSDDFDLNTKQAWRFENGKIVGVDGSAYSGDAYAKRGAYNRNELTALSHQDTLKDQGALIPTSMRIPPDGKRSAVTIAYKDAIAAKNRTSTRNVPDPMYARRFQSMNTDETYAGVFGRDQEGGLTVAWINSRELA